MFWVWLCCVHPFEFDFEFVDREKGRKTESFSFKVLSVCLPLCLPLCLLFVDACRKAPSVPFLKKVRCSVQQFLVLDFWLAQLTPFYSTYKLRVYIFRMNWKLGLTTTEYLTSFLHLHGLAFYASLTFYLFPFRHARFAAYLKFRTLKCCLKLTV